MFEGCLVKININWLRFLISTHDFVVLTQSMMISGDAKIQIFIIHPAYSTIYVSCLMMMLGLNEAIDQLCLWHSVCVGIVKCCLTVALVCMLKGMVQINFQAHVDFCV